MAPTTASSPSGFTITRASPNDLPEIVALEYDSFERPAIRELFMGCYSKDSDLPKLIQLYTDIMLQNPTDIWIKVVDTTTGKIVAACNWKLYLGPATAIPRGCDEVPSWLEGEQAAATRALLEPMDRIRIESNPQPFLHLHICFTAPQYRRQGIGSMMMKWGCELADLLSVSMWVEASPEGNLLYKRFGFYEYRTLSGEGDISGVCMRRDAQAVPSS